MDLLIKASHATNADTLKNVRGCYKRGQLVLIKPTGHEWGREEAKPPAEGGKFVIVRLLREDGVTPVWSVGDEPPARVTRYMEPERSDLVFETVKDNDGVPQILLDDQGLPIGVPVRRRRYALRVDDLPTAVCRQLRDTGLYVVQWTTARDFLRDLQTGADESSADLTVR
jgi:hypothetical protein